MREGASGEITGTDRLLAACQHADQAAVERLLARDPGLPVDARGDDGGAALHAAAYSGSAPAVRLLLDRGAGVEARDTTWNSTPIEWAAIGSGERPAGHPHPDWTGAVQALLDAGASARDITLSPDDPKPPISEVATLRSGPIPATGSTTASRSPWTPNSASCCAAPRPPGASCSASPS